MIHLKWSTTSLEDRFLAQIQLLVTASVAAFRSRIESPDDPLEMVDMPRFAVSELGVRGLSIPASMLTGLDATALERIRDEADRARCPTLLLYEEAGFDLGTTDAATRAAAIDRIGRLARAASMLGCANLGIACSGANDEVRFDLAAVALREVMRKIDRHDVNLLLGNHPGLTEDPDRLTELIKKVGGFRIGSLPDFRTAHDSGDYAGNLRRLAPYAGTIMATVGASARGRKPAAASKDKTPFDVVEGLRSVLAVGYQHAISLDHAGGKHAAAAIIAARELLEEGLESHAEGE
jgi:sugar phosphate isomerase/epimerase